jgi:hypothetical protein
MHLSHFMSFFSFGEKEFVNTIALGCVFLDLKRLGRRLYGRKWYIHRNVLLGRDSE